MSNVKPAKPAVLADSEQTQHATPRVVVGNTATAPAPAAKTSGIQMRGTGAATKGKMSRGPMG